MESEKQFIGGYSDARTADALKRIAVLETDGNVSMALRKLVREGAERRGVLIETKTGDKQGGAHA